MADRLRDRCRDPGTDPSPPLSFSLFSPLLFLFFSFPFPLPSSLLSPTLRAWPLLPLRSRSPRPLLLLGTARPRHHPPSLRWPEHAPRAARHAHRARTPACPAPFPLALAPRSARPRAAQPGTQLAAHTAPGQCPHERPCARTPPGPRSRAHRCCPPPLALPLRARSRARPSQPRALTPRRRPPLTPYRRRRPRHSDTCSGHRLPEASRRLAEPRPPLTPAPTAITSAAGLRRTPPSRHRLSTPIKGPAAAPPPHTPSSELHSHPSDLLAPPPPPLPSPERRPPRSPLPAALQLEPRWALGSPSSPSSFSSSPGRRRALRRRRHTSQGWSPPAAVEPPPTRHHLPNQRGESTSHGARPLFPLLRAAAEPPGRGPVSSDERRPPSPVSQRGGGRGLAFLPRTPSTFLYSLKKPHPFRPFCI